MKSVQAFSTWRWLAMAGAGIMSLSITACSSEQPADSNVNGPSENTVVPASEVQDNADELSNLPDPESEDMVGHDAGKGHRTREPYGCAVSLTYLKDVPFIDFMVAHHRTGIDMDDMVIERGQREEVKQLAQKDKEERAHAIAIMLAERARMTDDTKTPPAARDPKMDIDMAVMRKLSGKRLDNFYLRELLPFHAPTIDVANRSLTTLESKTIRQVALDTFEEQSVEMVAVEVLRGKVQGVADKSAAQK